MQNSKNWNDMSDQERTQLEREWAEDPGMIDYVIAHLTRTKEEIDAAVEVLTEIKENAGPEMWTNVSPEELLYLLLRKKERC